MANNFRCFWRDFQIQSKEYSETLVMLCRAATIVEFWQGVHHLPLSSLGGKCSQFLMRAGVKPIWEEEKLKEGVQFNLRLSKANGPHVWEELLMAAVGERLETGPNDLLAGLSFNSNNNDTVIRLWYSRFCVSEDVVFRKLSSIAPIILTDPVTVEGPRNYFIKPFVAA